MGRVAGAHLGPVVVAALGLLAALVLLAAPVTAVPDDPAPTGVGPPAPAPEVVVFYGSGCPYCARELAFLQELSERVPAVRVQAYEVWYDEGNLALLAQTAARLDFDASAVPITVIGSEVWIGFDSSVADQVEATLLALAAGEEPPEAERRTTVDVPLLGTVDLGGRSLLLSTVVIGFVDGVNPCSLWVLTVLLAVVLHSGSRRRVLLVGTVFLTVTAALYGVYVLGLFTALSVVGVLPWIRGLTAAVAAVFGVLHLREHAVMVTGADLPGPSVSLDGDRKPGFYRRMRSLTAADVGLPMLVGGTAALAVGVSLAETPCTAGLPMLWANLVQDAGLAWTGRGALFAVYLVVFLVDELLVFGAAVVTMRAAKLQERHGAALQLLSGVLMVVLAGVLVLAPELLDTVGGAAAVFAAAGLLVVLVLWVERAVLRRPAARPQDQLRSRVPRRPARPHRQGERPSGHRARHA